jgi:DNA-binding MarR family transcriptional regulator
MEWQVESRVVCIDCFKMLKNQKLIDEVVKRVEKVEVDTTKTGKKVKEDKPKREITNYRQTVLNHLKNTDKPLSVREMYADRVSSKVTLERWLKVLLASGEVVAMKSTARAYYIDADRKDLLDEYIESLKPKKKTTLPDEILKRLKSLSRPSTASQINEEKTWVKKSVYTALVKLVKAEKVVFIKLNKVKKIYIDIDRKHLLDEFNQYKKVDVLGGNRKKALDFINSSNGVTYIKDLTKLLGTDKSTSLRVVYDLIKLGLVKVAKGKRHNAALVIVPTNNEYLLEEFKLVTYDSTENILRRFMEEGNAVTLDQCYFVVGCKSGSGGTRRYVRRLLKEWKCEITIINGVKTYRLPCLYPLSDPSSL